MSGTGLNVSPDLDPEDVLAHYGVKGMQWGKTKVRPDTAQIKTARKSIAEEKSKLDAQGRRMQSAGSKTREAERSKYEEMKVDFLKNPDRVVAARLTTGQKVVGGVLAWSGVATVPIVAYAGGRQIAKTVIDQKQKRGAYDR